MWAGGAWCLGMSPACGQFQERREVELRAKREEEERKRRQQQQQQEEEGLFRRKQVGVPPGGQPVGIPG